MALRSRLMRRAVVDRAEVGALLACNALTLAPAPSQAAGAGGKAASAAVPSSRTTPITPNMTQVQGSPGAFKYEWHCGKDSDCRDELVCQGGK